MFERFTERARRVLFFARFEASQLGSSVIESEHLLLGLVREGKGVTSRLFADHKVSLVDVRRDIEGRAVSRDSVPTSVEIPFSAECKRILENTADEAVRLLHNYIGTEHLLLGILREDASAAARMLTSRGLRLQPARDALETLLSHARGTHEEGSMTDLAGSHALLDRPHIVLVQVTVRPELLDEFEAVLLHNARESLTHDKGCLRFDVSQSIDDPARWVLHEVYTTPDAHAAHRQSAHFLTYNEVAERAVSEKSVMRLVGRHVGA